LPTKPTFNDTLKFWLKLGFISFGGPAGQVAIMHEFLVEKKKWISESKFLHALNYCMILPGPEAQQLATYIGWLLYGVRGGLVAGILFVLPSVFILLGLSIVYVMYGTLPWVAALFYGLKPAVVAIVILALIKIGKKSLLSPFHYLLALASFVCIFLLNISFPLIIIGALVIGFLLKKFAPEILHQKSDEKKSEEKEDEYYINKNKVIEGTGFNITKFVLQILAGVFLWVLPFLILLSLTDDKGFWTSIVLFFTESAFVTFGGAYAVLPFVAQVSVEKFRWLSKLQMIDGLALGETTPGPLIMVLAFVGFMAGFNHYDGSLTHASFGLLTIVYYTFLPCFLFIFIGAPIIETTQNSTTLKSVLSVVTAAVVGVVLNLTVYFFKAVVFPKSIHLYELDYVALVWVLISFLAMYRFKIDMIKWIGISAVTGLLYYLVKK
jgi:chromate transporter